MNRGERGINSTGFDSIHGLGYAEGLGKGAVLGGAAMLGVGLPPLIRGYAVYEGASPVLTRNTAALMEYITYQADPRAVFLAGLGAIIVLSGSAYSILASQRKGHASTLRCLRKKVCRLKRPLSSFDSF